MKRTSRQLYDEEFVNSGCDASFFADGLSEVEQTAVDTTVGTWATNYFILGLGVFGALFMARKARTRQPQETTLPLPSSSAAPATKRQRGRWMLVSRYYICMGISYGWAGIHHQIHERKSAIKWYWTFIAHVFSVLAVLCLQFLVIDLSNHSISRTDEHESYDANDCWNRSSRFWARCGLIVVALMVLALSAILDSQIWIGGYILVSMFLLATYFSYYQRDAWVSLGCLSLAVGLLSQQLLSPVCGDKAYKENCFEDCPFPNPIVFNHNGLFHCLVLIGMILQFFGRYTQRSF